MNDNPLVSICIPCYNNAWSIEETLRSVLVQTYTNMEIILCDNQSSDNTVEIIRQFKDPRIQIHENERNIGPLKNPNKVMSLARGKYVKFLCADDLLTPDCIEKQICAFEEHAAENVVLVTATKWVINKKGMRQFKVSFPRQGLINGHHAVAASVRRGRNSIGEPGLVLMRRDVLQKTSGMTEDDKFTYVSDFDLWCKMLEYGNLFTLKETLFLFRLSGCSVSASLGSKQAKTMRDYISFLQEQGKHNISKTTSYVGKFMTIPTSLARNLIYAFLK